MKRIYTILLCLLTFTYMGCKDDSNEWPVDPEFDRPFSPTTFEIGEARPTSLKLAYTGVGQATNYLFEFSEVQLEGSDQLGGGLVTYEGDRSHFFDKIDLSVNILADTLTATNDVTSESARKYETWFDDLKGLTVYAIRMKALTSDGRESKYTELLVKTPPEQIFTRIVGGLGKATIFWESDKEVTNLRYGEINETSADTTWIANISLDGPSQSAGKYVAQDLTLGTSYVAEIYNNENKRGTLGFKTLGIKPGSTVGVINVTSEMDVNAEMTACVEAGQTDLMIIFKSGDTHSFTNMEGDVSSIIVPEGATSAYFIGDVEVDGKLPEVQAISLSVQATGMTELSFQYIDLNASGSGFFMVLSGTPFDDFTAEGCIIRNIPYTLIRSNGVALKNIALNNCVIQNVSTSGWGIFNFMTGSLNTLSFTNCTLIDINDQITDIRVQLEKYRFDRCILCNYNTKMAKIFLFDKEPNEIAVTNSIFCGNNQGGKLKAGNSNYSYFDYMSCYMTSDLTEDSSTPFSRINKLEETTEDLFVNPRNGDFHINPNVKFPGDGIAGPSRWWTQK